MWTGENGIASFIFFLLAVAGRSPATANKRKKKSELLTQLFSFIFLRSSFFPSNCDLNLNFIDFVEPRIIVSETVLLVFVFGFLT